MLGYVSNQTMMLEKLVLFSGNRDPQEFLDAHATGIQQQMLLRLAAFDFRRQIALVKFVGTHPEYNAIDALTVARS